jgi:hypothetical protein
MTAVRMIIPSGGRAFAIAREKGKASHDEEGLESARYMGKMMVKMIAITNQRKSEDVTSTGKLKAKARARHE